MMISTLAEIGHDVKPPAIYESVPSQDRIAGIYSKSKSHRQVEKLQWALDMVTFMKATIKSQSDMNHIQHQALKDVRGGLDFLRRIITEVSEGIK
jgi:hypothetical protein